MEWREVVQAAGHRLPSGAFPGYSNGLEFHHLSSRDSLKLSAAMHRSRAHFEKFLPVFDESQKLTLSAMREWISDRLDEHFPTQHFVFSIGRELVGFGSTLPISNDLREIQLRYMVFEGHTGKGVATAMAKTMEFYGFHVWGFDRIYIEMDSANRASLAVAQRLGYELHGTKELSKIGTDGSGLWFSFVKVRPREAQAGTLDDWSS